MATLPGQDKPEFLLLVPFTPRNKDNLIGLMVARCDGATWATWWCCCYPNRS
jgi:uncharacterized membrane protein (UPF0182 family)